MQNMRSGINGYLLWTIEGKSTVPEVAPGVVPGVVVVPIVAVVEVDVAELLVLRGVTSKMPFKRLSGSVHSNVISLYPISS